MRILNIHWLRWKSFYCLLLVCVVLLLLYHQSLLKIEQSRKMFIPKISKKIIQKRLYFNTNQSQEGLQLLKEWKAWNIPMDTLKIQGNVKYTQFTMKPFIWKRSSLVCLATQTTVDRLHEIIEVARNWKGRMSTSVYVPDREFTKAKIILWLLQHCLQSPSSELTFYLAFELKEQPVDDLTLWEGVTLNMCKNMTSVVDFLEVKRGASLYPQNSMRNIAREECNSEYVILSDNDMIPTPGLSKALQPVLIQQRSCEKCAFVIPGYEFENTVTTLPTNKKELIGMVKQKLARPYHWEYYRRNQESHNPKRWERLKYTHGVQIAYPILVFQLSYEPVYAARKPLPMFDNRFIGYGLTRNSQIFEMMAVGYSFYLLDNAFLMHRGMWPSNYSLDMRSQELGQNRHRFIAFAKDILRQNGRKDIVKKMKKGRERVVLMNNAQNIYNFNLRKRRRLLKKQSRKYVYS